MTMNAAAVLLGDHAAHRAALRCGTQTLSHGELRDRVARCAALWRECGIGPGGRVAIKLPDGIDWVVAFLGAIWAGAIAVPVNPRLPVPEWQRILDQANFDAILVESIDPAAPPSDEHAVLLDDWRQAIDRATPMPPMLLDENAPALWCHSSGTSGNPKAVVHAHRFALQVERVSREGLGLVAGDRLFASSRLFFVYPQANSLFAGLKLGATVILDPQWPTAASVAATVAEQRPTVLFSVPSLYRNLLHDGLAPAVARSGVRLCVSAGEALPASLRDAWRAQTGLTIVNGYGASETMILVMLDRGDGCGFRPSPGIDIQPLELPAAGTPTRLCIGASTLATGYFDRPLSADQCRAGVFCPADLFLPNESGGWHFAGREDSLVKIRGRWVDLVDLEERLGAAAPGIVEAAAVCVPDGDGVDALAFFYVPSDARAAGAALRAGADALPPHQRPRWLHKVGALPRTATGKLLRRSLQEWHGAAVTPDAERR